MLIGLTSFVNSCKIDFCCTLVRVRVRVRVSTKIKGKNSCSHFFAFVQYYLSTVGWDYLRICLWESVWHSCVLHLLNNNWNDKKKDIKLLFTNIIVIIFQICALLKTALIFMVLFSTEKIFQAILSSRNIVHWSSSS